MGQVPCHACPEGLRDQTEHGISPCPTCGDEAIPSATSQPQAALAGLYTVLQTFRADMARAELQRLYALIEQYEAEQMQALVDQLVQAIVQCQQE